jgi:hypothetical protein
MSLCELIFLGGQEYGSGRRLANVQVSAVLIDQGSHSAERLFNAAHTVCERDDLAREPWGWGEHHVAGFTAIRSPVSITQ